MRWNSLKTNGLGLLLVDAPEPGSGSSGRFCGILSVLLLTEEKDRVETADVDGTPSTATDCAMTGQWWLLGTFRWSLRIGGCPLGSRLPN